MELLKLEALKPGEVHLKYAFVEDFKVSAAFANALTLLSDDEKTQFDRYAFEKDKNLYLLARYVLRTTLSKYFSQIAPAEWEFKFNPFGRPFIANTNRPENLHFNISHSDGIVVCAFAAIEEVGVDIENAERECSYLELAERYFSKLEFEKLKTSAESDVPKEFFKFWTLKESYIKARGMGLHIPLEQFSFIVVDSENISIQIDPRLKDDPKRWQFKLFKINLEYQVVVALVSNSTLRTFEEHSVFTAR